MKSSIGMSVRKGRSKYILDEQNWHTVTTDEEKAEVLNDKFALVFTGNLSSHTSQVEELQDWDWGGKVLLTEREDQFVTTCGT